MARGPPEVLGSAAKEGGPVEQAASGTPRVGPGQRSDLVPAPAKQEFLPRPRVSRPPGRPEQDR